MWSLKKKINILASKDEIKAEVNDAYYGEPIKRLLSSGKD